MHLHPPRHRWRPGTWTTRYVVTCLAILVAMALLQQLAK